MEHQILVLDFEALEFNRLNTFQQQQGNQRRLIMKVYTRRKRAKTPVNWLDLSQDLMVRIFIKVGTMDLLENVQYVCSSWRTISTDPQLYRTVTMHRPPSYDHSEIEKMAMLAINRSQAGLIKFYGVTHCSDRILHEITVNSPLLKTLNLAVTRNVSNDRLMEAIAKLPVGFGSILKDPPIPLGPYEP